MKRGKWWTAALVVGFTALAGCGEPERIEDPLLEAQPRGRLGAQGLSATVRASVEEVAMAARMALNDLGMLNAQSTVTGPNALVTAAAADGKRIIVDVRRQARGISTFTLAIGTMGETELGRMIFNRTLEFLEAGVARTPAQVPQMIGEREAPAEAQRAVPGSPATVGQPRRDPLPGTTTPPAVGGGESAAPAQPAPDDVRLDTIDQEDGTDMGIEDQTVTPAR